MRLAHQQRSSDGSTFGLTQRDDLLRYVLRARHRREKRELPLFLGDFHDCSPVLTSVHKGQRVKKWPVPKELAVGKSGIVVRGVRARDVLRVMLGKVYKRLAQFVVRPHPAMPNAVDRGLARAYQVANG